MSKLKILFIVYLVVVNLVEFILLGIDKKRARRKNSSHRRIPEAMLIAIAVAGGSVGGILGMWYFHHKTRHRKFKLGMPLILAAQVALMSYLIYLYYLYYLTATGAIS